MSRKESPHSINQQSRAASVRDEVPHDLVLVKQLTVEQLCQWLQKHPGIGSDYQKDIKKLRGMYKQYTQISGGFRGGSRVSMEPPFFLTTYI